MTACKFKKIIPLLILLLLSIEVVYSREPRKITYIFGGGGEPSGPSTMFDKDLKLMANFVKKSDWESIVSFNGGHSETEEIIKNSFNGSRNAGSFSEANYNKLVNEMIIKLESGELKKGDQLMLNFDTHGSQNNGSELTHRVSVSNSAVKDFNTLSGSRSVSLDGLKKLADLAAEKEVKLAIIDSSCFSGNLLAIKNPRTCLISATGDAQYSYGGTLDLGLFNLKTTFNGKFVGQFKKGRNLEEMFLSAREAAVSTPDYPMISTLEGQEVDKKIYKMISPYLKFNDKKSSNFTSQYPREFEKFEEQACQFYKNHNDIVEFLKQFESLASVTDELNKNEFSSLISALKNYRNYQLEYENAQRNIFLVNEEIKEILRRDSPHEAGFLLNAYNPSSILMMDLDADKKMYQGFVDGTANNDAKKYWQEIIDGIEKKKVIVMHLKNNLSTLSKKRLEEFLNIQSKAETTRKLSTQIATEAKKVYSTLYKQAKKSESNPCRDFIL